MQILKYFESHDLIVICAHCYFICFWILTCVDSSEIAQGAENANVVFLCDEISSIVMWMKLQLWKLQAKVIDYQVKNSVEEVNIYCYSLQKYIKGWNWYHRVPQVQWIL